MRLSTKLIFLLIVITSLPSCIIVDDFGVYWNRGIADPDVVGKWQRNDGFIINFIEEDGSLILLDKEGEKRTYFRTIGAVGYKFFLIREDDEDGNLRKDGIVLLYKTDEKNLYRFALNKESEGLSEDLINILKKSGYSEERFTGHLGLDAIDDGAFMAGVTFLKKSEHLKSVVHLRRVKEKTLPLDNIKSGVKGNIPSVEVKN